MRLYQQLKNLYHFFQAHFWRVWFGNPQRGMHVYGITGTNGKTTTSYILRSILAARYGEEKTGMLTTVAFRIGEKEIVNETKLTTLPSKTVYRYLREMKKAGVKYVVLEMTSHALDQRRCAGLKLSGGIILNIEREHLDYHKTIEAYTKAKLRIIDYLQLNSPLVIKGDDEWIDKGLSKLPITNYQLPITRFTREQAASVNTPLEGDVNKENMLAASLLASAMGIKQKFIDKGVRGVTHVPGRMEWIVLGTRNWVRQLAEGARHDRPRVLIDYAVTPEALERLYRYVREQMDGLGEPSQNIPGGGDKRVVQSKQPALLVGREARLSDVTPERDSETVPYIAGATVPPGGGAGPDRTRHDIHGSPSPKRGRIFALLGAAGLRDRGKRPDMAKAVAKYADVLVLTREDPWTEPEDQIFNDLEQGLVDVPRCADLDSGSEAGMTPCWQKIVDRREALKWLLEQAGPEDVVVVTGKGAERGMGVGKKIIPWNDREVILQLLQELKESYLAKKI